MRRFRTIQGIAIEKIPGQNRYASGNTDIQDFTDAEDWLEEGGYPGQNVYFYDLATGDVEAPFAKKKNTVFSRPLFSDGKLYILAGDFTAGTLRLYGWTWGEKPEVITELPLKDVDLYNLSLMGEGVHIVSQEAGKLFRCYYPEKFSFAIRSNETAECISDRKVYLSAWHEDGWDEENNRMSEHYRYYESVTVRDFAGQVLSEETGSLCQDDQGTWWLS